MAAPARPAPASAVLGSASRMAILHLLQGAGGPVAVEAVAEHLGVHVNTAREHLERLRASGFVDRSAEARTTRGRPRVLYRCVDRPAGAGLDPRLRDRLLADAAAAEAVPDGCRRQLAALEVHLEEIGLDPVVDPVSLAVGLHRCPFLPLARARTEQVCTVHLELIRGVLADTGGPVGVRRLEPFAGPSWCVLHLELRADTAGAPAADAPAGDGHRHAGPPQPVPDRRGPATVARATCVTP